MSKLSSILNTLNSVAGIGTRHNKALRDVKDWIEQLQRFLSRYELYGRPDFALLLEKIGEAKLELTTIAHRTRPLIRTSKNIKDQSISPLIKELIERIEALRRVLSNSYLRETKLGEAVKGLRVSCEKLQDTLSDIDYK